jgi:hypothetical protein
LCGEGFEWFEGGVGILVDELDPVSSGLVERRTGDLLESDLFGVCLPSRHIFCFFAVSFFFVLDTRSRRDISLCPSSSLVLVG